MPWDLVPERDSRYFAGFAHQTTATVVLTDQRVLYVPFGLTRRAAIDALEIGNITAGGAGSAVRLGIYRDTGLGLPGALSYDAGTVATTGTGGKTISFTARILDAGIYWLAVVLQGGTPPTATAYGSALTTEGDTGAVAAFQDSVSGALPSTATTTGVSVGGSGVPRVLFYIAPDILVAVGAAEETDEALALEIVQTPFVPGTVTQAREEDTALTITPRIQQRVTVGQAVETDSARELAPISPVRNLVTSGSGADVASFTTTAYTPVGNRLVLAYVQSRPNNLALTPATPTMTGNGYTWVQVATVLDAAGDDRGTLFRALVASPTEGAATIDFGGQLQEYCSYSIAEIRGVDTSGTNGSGAIVQAVTGTVATDSILLVILASFADTDNIAFAGFGMPTFRTVNPGTLSTVGSFGLTGAGTILTEWKVNETATGVIVSAPTTINGIAVEIKTV